MEEDTLELDAATGHVTIPLPSLEGGPDGKATCTSALLTRIRIDRSAGVEELRDQCFRRTSFTTASDLKCDYRKS